MSTPGDITPGEVVAEAVASGQLPGAVAIYGDHNHVAAPIVAGVRRLGGPAVTADTRYDLASLSKVVSTLPLVLQLVAEGALTLETRVGDVIANAGWFQSPGVADATIRELLTHTSGLPAWRPVYAWTSDRLTALGNVLQTPLEKRGTEKTGVITYSDLGFITLGAIVERVTRKRQDVVAKERLFDKLGMNQTSYGPVGAPVAATEDCGWRNEVLEGVVHDENAFRLDGVAGHAGLFGTAGDLATYAQAWLSLDPRLGEKSLLDGARREQVNDGQVRRGFGWLLRGNDSFGGPASTVDGFGHTGFTGNSLWIEPGWFAVLLSNRVHPSRKGGPAMHAIRKAFHAAVAAEVLGERLL